MRVAFIGLGVMGYPMAAHLAKSGHDVSVFNRTRSTADSWVTENAGRLAMTPREAANGVEIAFTCVGNDDDVREVLLGEAGVISGLESGTVVVDHTTCSATVAQEMSAAARERAVAFVDAPVSGGQVGAENGQLTVMLGGELGDVARVTPLIDCYAKAITHIGPVGSGQLAKMVNQICIAGVVQGLAEGLHFAAKAGLDPASVIESISKGAAQSWQMENRWQTMTAGEFDFGFAVDWMRKDLAIVLAEAENNGAVLEMTERVDQFYKEVQDLGGSRWDTSSLIARLT